MFIGNYADRLKDINDPNGSQPLESIAITSQRILSLIVRNKAKISDMHDFARIYGSWHFVQGLEYHYCNFLSHLHVLGNKDQLEGHSILDHEAVAYLHRVGQFYYFAKTICLLNDCPKIKELYLFRKKSIGHRSIDCPHGESIGERTWQAGCFMRRKFAGWVKPDFNPQTDLFNDIEKISTPKKYLISEIFVSYTIMSKGEHSTFTPQKDHSIILTEIEQLYSKLFDSRSILHELV